MPKKRNRHGRPKTQDVPTLSPCSKRPHVSATTIPPATPRESVSTVELGGLSAALSRLGLGDTPKRTRKGKRVESKVLFPVEKIETPEHIVWSEAELQTLTSFLMIYTDGKSWVGHKDDRFWRRTGVFLQQSLHTTHCRSGMCVTLIYMCACIICTYIYHIVGKACRTKVSKSLSKHFASPPDAEKHYHAAFPTSPEVESPKRCVSASGKIPSNFVHSGIVS